MSGAEKETRRRPEVDFTYFGKAALAADQGVKLGLEFAELGGRVGGKIRELESKSLRI